MLILQLGSLFLFRSVHRSAGGVLVVVLGGVLVAWRGPRLGLPRRFALLVLAPFVGPVALLVPMWRLACLPHPYWHGVDDHFPPRTQRGTAFLASVDGAWLGTLAFALVTLA